jgi:hypothetical protein
MNDIRKELAAVLAMPMPVCELRIESPDPGAQAAMERMCADSKWIRKHGPALLKLLEQPAQDPVGHVAQNEAHGYKVGFMDKDLPLGSKLYAAPQPAQAKAPEYWIELVETPYMI